MSTQTRRFSGARLREIRHHKGWTQAELARRSGVRERQIIRWENDQNEPRIEAVSNIAAATGESIDAFFVGTDQEVAPSGGNFRVGAGADVVPGDRRTRGTGARGKGDLAA